MGHAYAPTLLAQAKAKSPRMIRQGVAPREHQTRHGEMSQQESESKEKAEKKKDDKKKKREARDEGGPKCFKETRFTRRSTSREQHAVWKELGLNAPNRLKSYNKLKSYDRAVRACPRQALRSLLESVRV